MSEKITQKSLRLKTLLLYLSGPTLAVLIFFFFPDKSNDAASAKTAAIAVWMGAWWLTECVPLAVTSLLPLILFPLSGVISAGQVAGEYTNDVVFLFIGGFLVALAMERWDLHKRIALRILLLAGGGPIRTLFGFMCATAMLSMWISNTATAMMMVPIAAAVLSRYSSLLEKKQSDSFAVALLLGIAYSASLGGMATLVGTPPNLVFVRIFLMYFPDAAEITFAKWMLFALPLTILFFLLTWMLLTLLYLPRTRASIQCDSFQDEMHSLGKMSIEEKIVLVVFLLLACLWVTREPLEFGIVRLPGWSQLFPHPEYIGDGTVAITLALLFFLIPSINQKGAILDARVFSQLPWGIVLLFGGGFALAKAITVSGLSQWIGSCMEGLSSLPDLGLIASICTVMTFLTELTSNTATTQMALPVLGATAIALGRNPISLMIPATLSASCAFMMPVATPPNAIVFGTGRIRIIQMARTGLLLNLIGVVLITLWTVLVGLKLLE